MQYLFYILGAGSLWGIISIFVSQLQQSGFSSLEVVALRALCTSIVMLIWILWKEPKKIYIKWHDLPYFLGTGICSIVLFNYCYFYAIKLIGGSAIPALLLYTAPAFVLLFSAIFFKEHINKEKFIALIVVFLGLILVTGAFSSEQQVSLTACLWGLGAGFGYALYSIFGKFVVDRYDASTITFYTFLIASIATVPFSGILEHVHVLFAQQVILSVIGMGVFCTVLPFLLYTKGLSGMEAGRASLAATIEPIVAALVGIFYFNEQISLTEGIGMLLVLSSIIALNLFEKDK